MSLVNDFSETPTQVDTSASERAVEADAYWQRVKFHLAGWEADELHAEWQARASNYSDNWEGEPTQELPAVEQERMSWWSRVLAALSSKVAL
jgi:hypothetical protein